MAQVATVVVRPFARGDARFVHDTAIEAFAEYDGGAISSRALSMVSQPGAHALIAEDGARQVGFAIVVVEGTKAHLSAIAVARGVRGRGIGRELLRAAERRAIASGARVIRLETGEANLAAMDLFVRAGYVLEGRLPRYYRTGYDALRYAKRL